MLLDKLSYYGVNGDAKNLPQSYLSYRHHVVDFNGSTSDILEIKTGPGPTGLFVGAFFSVYIHDLPSCTNIIMYADDTSDHTVL